MSQYAIADFAESIDRVGLRSEPVRVVAAWGEATGMGGYDDDDRYYGQTEWTGGFVVLLADGGFAYLTGWNDYSGWGCQDGANVAYFDAEPDLATLTQTADPDDDWRNQPVEAGFWDRDPADLNLWLAAGRPDRYSPDNDYEARMAAASSPTMKGQQTPRL